MTPSVRGTVPDDDSQPIPSVEFDNELQLAEMGSPYFTTTLLRGLISIMSGQSKEALTGVPIGTHSTD